MYKDTITLFNRVSGGWIPTVLTGVDLNADRGAIIQQYGANSTDNAKLHIICGTDGSVNGISVHSPKSYAGEGIAFRYGNDFDFFWHGVWEEPTPVESETVESETAESVTVAETVAEDDPPIKDSDYTNGFYDYMRKNFDEVYCITSVARYSVIPHYEILAR